MLNVIMLNVVMLNVVVPQMAAAFGISISLPCFFGGVGA
jgi:hypothetical protein